MSTPRKIYHLHIRKTAGRSVHHAVFALSGADPKETYLNLAKNAGKILEVGPYKFGGWLSDMARDFDYGFSHKPFYELSNLQAPVTIICCLRDPMQRFLSHWKMLKHYVETRAQGAAVHPGLEPEMPLFDEDLERFFDKLPPFHRFNHLHMFSKTGDLQEAVKAMSRMDLILESEDLAAGMRHLFAMLGRPDGETPNIGATPISATVSPEMQRTLRDAFAPEYELLDAARTMKGHYRNK